MKKLLIPPVFVFLCLLLIVVFPFLFPENNGIAFPVNLSGILIAAAGVFLMGKAWYSLRKNNTSLMPGQPSFFVSGGIYSKTRNPMYLGMFLFLLGTAIGTGNFYSILAPVGFLLLMDLFFIPKEEKLMEKTFGQEYQTYKMKVRRWI